LFENMFVHLITVFENKEFSLFSVDVPKEGFTLFALNAYCF